MRRRQECCSDCSDRPLTARFEKEKADRVSCAPREKFGGGAFSGGGHFPESLIPVPLGQAELPKIAEKFRGGAFTGVRGPLS